MRFQACSIAFCLILVTLLFPAQSYSANSDVKIEDPILEKEIRNELKLEADQTLNLDNLEKLTSLYPKGKEKIKSLKGLERASNLTKLFLPNQEITDISPLRNLYQLEFLALDGNQIQNICPISNMTKIQQLLISNNQIKDISCLSRLTGLTDLLASKNQIQDIASLSKLPIKWLDVTNNPVSDITPINSMKALRTLFIEEDKLNEKSKFMLQQLKQSGITVNKAPNKSDSTSDITVMVNEERVLFDHSPIVEAGTTLVQFRPLFEKLGFTIRWDNEAKTIEAEKESLRITLQVDNLNANLNGSPYVLPAVPMNVEGSIFVPLRFVGEASKYDVTWESSSKTIYLMPVHNVISPDGKSQITVSGQWLNKTPTIELSQIFIVNGNNVILSITDTPYAQSPIKSLGDYDKLIKKSLESQNIKEYGPDRLMKINGLEASQFSYSVNGKNGVNYTVVQTLIKGKYNYFRLIVLTGDLVYSKVNEEYQNIVNTFQEIKTTSQLNQEKFSALSPKERLLDAAHYYREAGFFQKDKTLTNQQFDDKFLEFYKGFATKNWDPFDSGKAYYDALADLYVLQQDKDRVWLEYTEADFISKDKNFYVETLKQWSAISRGSFLPSDIVETWDTEEGPITVSFMLNGQKKTIHPKYMYDYLDTEILKDLNEMMKNTGYQFAEIDMDEEVFITVLTAKEKDRIQQDRLLDFTSYQ